PWSPAQRARAEQALADTAFDGGEDNLPLLAEAIDAAAGGEAVLLWIHGPQPVAFARSGARLQPLLERSAALPRLVRYQAETGPAFAAGHAWFDTAREVAPSGDARADLAALLGDLAGGGERWEVTRRQSAEGGGPTGSAHIARLWGAERLAGAGQVRGAERGRAIALAHRLNIVTPVSGAVVLETDAEYERSGLAVPSAGDVPTVPEPATWALIAIVAALLLWQLRRRRLVPA
ncbi:MAG TPA: PEP-CTERM sorting domain-containing protein, partial [Allosphingosinicella sp.]